MSTFQDAGFEVIATGGSCTAWFKAIDDKGAHILITGLDGCSHELADESDAWIVGAHWELADGRAAWSDCLDAANVDDALKAARVIELAFQFAKELRADIGAKNFAIVIERNGTADYKASGACASHDFCDANMTMLAAWEKAFQGEPAFLSNPDDTASLDTVNRAWTFAKSLAFFTRSAA